MIYLWALCVTLCFFGWGMLVALILRLSNVSYAVAGAIGIAAITAAGGVLNYFQLITPAIVKTLVMGGTVVTLLVVLRHYTDLARRTREILVQALRRPRTALTLALIVSMVLLIGLVNVDRKLFARTDDFAAYLTYPKKTFSLGTVPAEPFSERRIISSMGANYFLESLMLPSGSLRSVAYVDTGFGYILLTFTGYSLFRAYGMSGWAAGLLSGLVLLLPFQRNNLQMEILPCALFAAIALIERTLTGWRFAVLFGLLGAAIVGMKQSYMPAALLLPPIYFLLRFLRGQRAAFWMLTVTFGIFIVAMLPWMIDSRRKEATYFYPVLGSGYHASAYGLAATFSHGGIPLLTVFSIMPLVVPLLILMAGVLISYRKRVPDLEMCLAMLTSAVLSVAAIGYATTGDSVGRYTLPFINAGLLLLLATVSLKRLPRWTGALFILWWCFLVGYYEIYHSGARDQIREIQAALASQNLHLDPDQAFLNDTLLKQYEHEAFQYQEVVPAGQRILALVPFSFPLDYTRNPIWLADFPGMASLPPGIPLSGPDELRAYFIANGLRYVAYSDDVDIAAQFREVERIPARRAILRAEFAVGARTLLAIEALKRRSLVLFDNKRFCVIDLGLSGRHGI